ncbi:MAG TPA: thioredoxin family protein [Cyclobacteriaceae bacterium]|nr:thioredoxin family protein [Cyclobacteriaceae bacterium]
MKSTVLFLVCVALLAFSPAKNGYEVGDTAADFKLKNVDGKMVSLSDFSSAKGFIIAFDCNTCPVSKAYNERIQALNEKYASKGFPVIAINPNSPELSSGESFDAMVKYAKKKGYKFPYLYDESQATVRAFGPTNTPHMFVLTKNGSDLKVAYIGAIDDNSRDADEVRTKYVEDAVDALLAGKAVATPKTKAVGCGVKLKSA